VCLLRTIDKRRRSASVLAVALGSFNLGGSGLAPRRRLWFAVLHDQLADQETPISQFHRVSIIAPRRRGSRAPGTAAVSRCSVCLAPIGLNCWSNWMSRNSSPLIPQLCAINGIDHRLGHRIRPPRRSAREFQTSPSIWKRVYGTTSFLLHLKQILSEIQVNAVVYRLIAH